MSLIKFIIQFIQPSIVLFSTFCKEAFALRESTDIASTISLVVSGLNHIRHPNK